MKFSWILILAALAGCGVKAPPLPPERETDAGVTGASAPTGAGADAAPTTPAEQ